MARRSRKLHSLTKLKIFLLTLIAFGLFAIFTYNLYELLVFDQNHYLRVKRLVIDQPEVDINKGLNTTMVEGNTQMLFQSQNQDIWTTLERAIGQEYLRKFHNKIFPNRKSSGHEVWKSSVVIDSDSWSQFFMEMLKNRVIQLWPTENVSNGIYTVDSNEVVRLRSISEHFLNHIDNNFSNVTKTIHLKNDYSYWLENYGDIDEYLKCGDGDQTKGLGKCQLLIKNEDHLDENYSGIDAQLVVLDSDNYKFLNDPKVKINFERGIPSHIYRIKFILESPTNTYTDLKRDRDLLASYWRGSDIYTPYYKWIYYNPEIKSQKQYINYAEGKTKLAAIFVSNCNTFNNRLRYVKRLQQYIEVDIYGDCGFFDCPKENNKKCLEMLSRDYYFYLAFENSNCRDYITEKFWNALNHETVPIVLGAHPDDYKEIAPHGSYIHIEDFNNTKQLAQYMLDLSQNPTKYNEYFGWKGTGQYVKEKLFCRICSMLHFADLVPPPERKDTLFWSKKLFCLPKNKWYWNKKSKNKKLKN